MFENTEGIHPTLLLVDQLSTRLKSNFIQLSMPGDFRINMYQFWSSTAYSYRQQQWSNCSVTCICITRMNHLLLSRVHSNIWEVLNDTDYIQPTMKVRVRQSTLILSRYPTSQKVWIMQLRPCLFSEKWIWKSKPEFDYWWITAWKSCHINQFTKCVSLNTTLYTATTMILFSSIEISSKIP